MEMVTMPPTEALVGVDEELDDIVAGAPGTPLASSSFGGPLSRPIVTRGATPGSRPASPARRRRSPHAGCAPARPAADRTRPALSGAT
jgi:hypothetical protein